MYYSSSLELLTDATGMVTFGWADEGVYYARFGRSLSAWLGEVFAGRLRAAALSRDNIKYFADARALESYDLLARSAFVRVVSEHRRRFEQINVLCRSDALLTPAMVSALGEPLIVTEDAADFETRLLRTAPRIRTKLAPAREASHRSR